MHAILLAAGTGTRLRTAHNKPKILLNFNNKSLLERHIKNLKLNQVKNITIVVGYENHLIIEKLKSLNCPQINVVFNSEYELGSIVSVFHGLKSASAKEDILLMDGDVLYDEKILNLVIENKGSCLAYDTDFEDDDEPVKVCMVKNQIQEFGKGKFSRQEFTTIGESVGFFKINYPDTVKFIDVCNTMISDRKTQQPHEDAIRNIIKKKIFCFKPIDITGLPWTEIDFPEDIEKAKAKILKTTGNND